MQVMIWTELKKLRRSRMLLVALFGLCMVLVIVTAQGFFAGGDEAYGMEPEWYLTGVQSLGTMYALPGIIALFGSYIICRESQEDVLKSLLLIPVNMGKMVVAKVMVILVFSVGTYLVLWQPLLWKWLFMPRSLRQRFFGTISKSIWWMEFAFSLQCCPLSA